jgi:hypothetical protein
VQVTGSIHAAKLLANWSEVRLQFKRVAPPLAVLPAQTLPTLAHLAHDIVKTSEDAAAYVDAIAAKRLMLVEEKRRGLCYSVAL